MSLDKRQRRRDHLPVRSPRSSAPMELEGQARPARSCRLLLPGPDSDEDEGEVVISIRPKSSPLPRRRSSISDEDSEPELTPCASRRVSFADAKGLSLVQMKEFDLWDVPNPPGMDFLDGEGVSAEEYSLSPLTFQSPLSPEDLLVRVQEQKIELEYLELIPGTTTLRGLICVLNMSFHKAVYVRATLDCWASHFDLLTEYIPASGDAHMDRFSFKLTLVPPFREQGSRVDFCLRYETPVGTFWANNNNENYVLLCHQRTRQLRENPHKQNGLKKSCLKTVSCRPDSHTFVDDTWEIPSSQRILSEGGATNGEKVDSDQVVHLPYQSEKDKNSLQAESENRQNCRQRNRRKAARMARLRDYFETDAALDDESDASHPENKDIPVEDQADVQSLSEEKPKLSEGSYSIMEKNFRETPQDKTQAHNEPQTPEDMNLASLRRGNASTDTSNDEAPPTEHCNTFVFEAEETNGTCQNRSNGFTFETAVPPLCRQTLGRNDDRTSPEQTEPKVQENLIRSKNQVPLAATFQKLVKDVDQKASLKHSKWSDSEDFAMNSTGNAQDHVIKNATDSRFDANLNVPLPENGTLNGEEGAAEAQRNSNVTKIHKDLDLPSGFSSPIQKLVSDNEDHQTRLGCADWSNTESSVAQATENTQSHEHILEDMLKNSTEHCLDDNLNVPVPEDDTSNGTQTRISLIKNNTDLVLLSWDFQTTPVPAMPLLEPLSETKTDDPLLPPLQSQSESVSDRVHQQASLELADWSEDAVTKSTEKTQNYDQLEENVIKDSTKECFDKDLNVPLPEDGYANESQKWDHRHTDGQSEPDHADGSDVERSEVESTTSSPSEPVNQTKVFRNAVNDGPPTQEPARTPADFIGSQREICCIGDERRRHFQEGDDEMTHNDRSQCASFFKDEANISQIAQSSAETRDAQNLETRKVEEEDGDDAKEIQKCPEIDKPRDLEEETEMASPEAEEPEDGDEEHAEMIFDVADVGEAEEGFAEMKEDKRKVEMWDEEVNHEDAKLVDTENKERQISGDDTEDKDHVRSEFDQNKLKDARLSSLIGRNPEDTDVQDEVDKTDEIADGLRVFAEQTESDDASAESDSDDEVELYMHCLRAVQTKDQSAEAAFSLSKRPALNKSRPLPSPMPSISESVDEEPAGCLQDKREDAQTDNAAQPQPSESERTGKNMAGRKSGSCGCISKTLLYVTLLAVFVVTAYNYDFLACFGLYLISVVWLLSQGEKQPIKDNSVG
ncbi:uncharacterized protein ppp1r3ab [Vanacampus margaritifer]